MTGEKITIKGIISEGLKAASGQRHKGAAGTIALQKPGLKSIGVEVDKLFNGTINLQLKQGFHITKPDYTLTDYEWIEGVFESFDILRCKIKYGQSTYEGYVYRPKESEHAAAHEASIVELLAPEIPGIRYGDRLSIDVAKDRVVLNHGMHRD